MWTNWHDCKKIYESIGQNTNLVMIKIGSVEIIIIKKKLIQSKIIYFDKRHLRKKSHIGSDFLACYSEQLVSQCLLSAFQQMTTITDPYFELTQ